MGKLIFRSSPVTTSGGDGNDGLIVSNYASFDPDAAQIVSLDVNSTVPNWGTYGGGNVTFANESWWNGTSSVATCFPPTTADSGSGFGSIPFWKNATKVVRQINIRWEFSVSGPYCADTTQLPKLLILRTYSQFQSSPSVGAERPMIFFRHYNSIIVPGPYDIDNVISITPAQGTTEIWSATNITPAPTSADWDETDPNDDPHLPAPIYWRATSGSDSAGNPMIAPSEVACAEMRVNVMSTASEPNGVIALRVYRRNGYVSERACAWTWESGHAVDTNYIADIDTAFGGYYNNSNSGASDIYTKVGRRFTFGFNIQPTVGRSWIGPPTGFVL